MVIGSGGREHAISWQLAKSEKVHEIICVPGNGGTANEAKCKNITIADCEYLDGITGIYQYSQIAVFEQVDFVVVGPENPLCDGVADALWECGIPVVGPKKNAAQLEGSKDFSKQFMKKHGVACASSVTVNTIKQATKYIEKKGAPIVVKADGLAAGKGVVVAATKDEALKAIHSFMDQEALGSAGKTIVLEEYLQGVEISVLAAVSVTPKTSESTIVPFAPSRDHKRLKDGAQGPNTGGMGAICPLEDIDDKTMALFYKNCMQPTLKGLIAENWDYRGFIFFGLMLTKDGPKLLEYNVRLGDPEAQAVLPLMDFDFAELCEAIIDKNNNGALKTFAHTSQNPAGNLPWKNGFVCAPVAVSRGYPGSYKKGYNITIEKKTIADSNAKIFIAGAETAKKNTPRLITSGGRVLACSAFGSTFDEAWNNAYAAIKGVTFDGMFYRKDIGLPGAAESGELFTEPLPL